MLKRDTQKEKNNENSFDLIISTNKAYRRWGYAAGQKQPYSQKVIGGRKKEREK